LILAVKGEGKKKKIAIAAQDFGGIDLLMSSKSMRKVMSTEIGGQDVSSGDSGTIVAIFAANFRKSVLDPMKSTLFGFNQRNISQSNHVFDEILLPAMLDQRTSRVEILKMRTSRSFRRT